MSVFLMRMLMLSACGTVLALLLLLLRRLLGSRLPSAFYYWAWLVVLLRFILPLPGLLPAPEDSGPSAELPHAVEFTETVPPENVAENTVRTAPVQMETRRQFVPVVPEENLHRTEYSKRETTWQQITTVLKSARFWVSVWALGALLTLGWFVGTYRRFVKSLRRTLKEPCKTDLDVYHALYDRKNPKLYRSRAVSTPMLFGLSHPVLVLPDREYDTHTLQGILCHELTHYRRRDLYTKWFAVLVSAIHWFNPIHLVIRKELDRACELACDERLLRHMDAEEKRCYGEMLLNMAAERALPGSVVATSLAVEKRNLKERLMQIMNFKKRGRASLALILTALLILTGCGAVMGPGGNPVSARVEVPAAAALSARGEDQPASAAGTGEVNANGAVTVSTMDELLAAIAPNTVILLSGTTFDENSASDYGNENAGSWYSWRNTYDGYELVVHDVENLTIRAMESEAVISARPRYANVLNFENCRDLTLEGFVAGHTIEPGLCAGGVLNFVSCENVTIDSTRLFGCGTMGITAVYCRSLAASNTEIYECSYGAVEVNSCRDVRLLNCSIHDCGKKEDIPAFQLINVLSSEGFALVNCDIIDNRTNELFAASYTDQAFMLGCRVDGNTVFRSVFRMIAYPIIVDKCSFTNNNLDGTGFYPEDWSLYCVNPEAEDLITFDLTRMQREEAVFDGFVLREPAEVSGTLNTDGLTEYHVGNVDELLAAIGSDRVIYLDADYYLWSDAAGYGTYGGEHYYWNDYYDGPSLTISGVSNLAIVGQGKDITTVAAEPRYADVFSFEDCENILVKDLTAGHTQEPGNCMGDVLNWSSCRNVQISGCGLFGCGVIGIDGWNVDGMLVEESEIYECSQAAVNLYNCRNVEFTGCSIHDNKNGNDDIVLGECASVSFDGKLLINGAHRFHMSEEVPFGASEEITAEPYYGPWAEFGPGSSEELGIYYYEITVNGGFTTHVDNDDVILLTARVGGVVVPAEWTVSQNGVLELVPTEDGMQIRALQPVDGGVMLTASWEGMSMTIPVYVLPALGN